MRSKMTGIILMVIGVLILGVGIIVFSISGKQGVVTAGNNEIGENVNISKDSLPTVAVISSDLITPEKPEVKNGSNSKVEAKEDNELEKVIEMAIADGVLTTNERELIKKTAISKGVDYVKVLDDVEKRVDLLEIDSETELVNLEQKNGLNFEKFIVQKFSTKLYKIKEWAGDKYVNGVYAETTQHPDLLVEFIGYGKNIMLAVECKWRKRSVDNGIHFSTVEQLNRYRNYEKEKKRTVFMAIGLGGKGAVPTKLHIVPLKDISKPFMLFSQLNKYEKAVNKNFYFDFEEEMLK